MMRRGFALIVFVLAALTARPSFANESPIDFKNGQWYQASLNASESIDVFFRLWLPQHGDEAVIRNGPEFIRVAFSQSGSTIKLDFPHFDSEITAQRDDDGFQGIWRKQRSKGVASLEFRAVPTSSDDWTLHTDEAREVWREVEYEPESIRFAIDFAESGVAIATVQLTGQAIETDQGWGVSLRKAHGTIETPTGDYRFLSGAYTPPGILMLTVFDGAHAFRINASPDPSSGDLQGEFYSGNWWHETFTARRLGPDEEFELPDPFSEVALTSGDGTLNIEALDKPRYQGKPVIVQIFGTWCPNCHDETPVLADLYERYREDGLEVLGLAYEVTGDDARSQRQVERFRKKFGIDWEIEIAGTSDKEQASKTLPDITAVKSFPTTIWIGRDGKVRAIHSGFSGPATGDEHVELVREFEELTAEIVGEE